MTTFEALIKSKTFNELLGEDLLSTLRCPVCMDYFTEPVVLLCGHTFCYDCLYDMSMHTKSRMMNVHIRNMRINCPNCRIPVSVQTILQRRCTTNYTLASFIDSLKDALLPVKTHSEASTNTEPEDEPKPEVEPKKEEETYEYDENKLNEIQDEMDLIFTGLNNNQNVIYEAWREVNKLRKEIEHSNEKTILLGKLKDDDLKSEKEHQDSCIDSKWSQYNNGVFMRSSNSLSEEDPAIIMSSVGISHSHF